MKNLFRSMMFVAAAAMTFVSCSKDPTADLQAAREKVTLRFTTDDGAEPQLSPESRTTFGEGYTIKWNDASDKVGIYVHDPATTTTLTANAEGGITRTDGVAQFSASVDPFNSADILCAYYPYQGTKTGNAGAVELTVPAEQQQVLLESTNPLTGFDGSYNPMVAVNYVFTQEEAATATLARPVKFRPLGAMGEFAVHTTQTDFNDEKIQAFSFTNSTADAVAGTFVYDLTQVTETAETTPIDKSTILPGEGSNRITLTVDSELAAPISEDRNANVLYLTALPGEYTGDFTVTTDKASYTFANKTVDFRRAYVRRFTLDLKNAVRSERITGPYVWNLASGDLSTNSSTPKTTVAAGSPAMQWNLACSDPCYFSFDRERGVQIGSSSVQGTATLTSPGYGDDVKSIVVNASVANSGQAQLSVYMDNTLLGTSTVTNTAAADFTFTPDAPAKAGNVRIEIKSALQRAMYLKSVTILSANSTVEPLPTPVLSAEGTTLTWEAIANAQGYQYTTDEGQTQTDISETTLNCSLWAPGTYSVQVRALADGLVCTDSEWSEPQNVTIENTATGRYVKITENQSDWSGKYLIAYVDGTNAQVFKGKNGNIGGTVNISGKLQADGSILSDATTDGYACEIAVSENGYSILSPDGYIGYTSTAATGTNNLFFSASLVAKQYEWTISVTNGNVTIQNLYNTGRTLRFNNDRFVPYGNTTGKAVHLYQLEDKTPRIVVADADKALTITAEALSGSTAFSSRNLTGDVTATVTEAAGDWFTATADNANGKIDWSATANESTLPRTAILTLSADGAEPVAIAVTQHAPAQVLGNVTANTPNVEGLEITFSWNSVENASGYAWRIVKSSAPDIDVQTGTTDRTTTTATIARLDPLTGYTFYVKAIGDKVNYLDSVESPVTAVSGAGTQLGSVSIGTPTVEGTTISFSWNSVENASGYAWRIVKSSAPDIDVQTGTTDRTTTTATIARLDPLTGYTFYVKAIGDGSSFTDSEEASFTVTTGEAPTGIALPKTFDFSNNTTAFWTPVFAQANTPTEHTYADGGAITVLNVKPTTASGSNYLAVAQNGYFILPAFDSAVSSIVLQKGSNTPSGNSEFTLYISTDGGTTYGDAAATAKYASNTYTFTLTDQTPGAIYKLVSSNSKAAQVASITVK